MDWTGLFEHGSSLGKSKTIKMSLEGNHCIVVAAALVKEDGAISHNYDSFRDNVPHSTATNTTATTTTTRKDTM